MHELLYVVLRQLYRALGRFFLIASPRRFIFIFILVDFPPFKGDESTHTRASSLSLLSSSSPLYYGWDLYKMLLFFDKHAPASGSLWNHLKCQSTGPRASLCLRFATPELHFPEYHSFDPLYTWISYMLIQLLPTPWLNLHGFFESGSKWIGCMCWGRKKGTRRNTNNWVNCNFPQKSTHLICTAVTILMKIGKVLFAPALAFNVWANISTGNTNTHKCTHNPECNPVCVLKSSSVFQLSMLVVVEHLLFDVPYGTITCMLL